MARVGVARRLARGLPAALDVAAMVSIVRSPGETLAWYPYPFLTHAWRAGTAASLSTRSPWRRRSPCSQWSSTRSAAGAHTASRADAFSPGS